MNLRQLIEACQRRSGMNDSNFDDHWRTFINQSIREFARVQPWDGLEDFVNVATDGTEYVILPPFVDSVLAITNLTQRLPVDRSGDWDREATSVFADRTAGTVMLYDKIGTVPVLRDPTGYLVLQSTHVSDLSEVYVTGRINNSGASGTGLQSTVSTLAVNATGTSPLTLSTLFASIISISKATDTNGDFYLFDAGASLAHISFLGQYDDAAAFKRIQLLYKPADQTLLRVRFRYKIPPLKADTQAPPPAVKPDFIIEHALALYQENREQYTKSDRKRQSATKILQDEAHKEQNFDEPHSQITPHRDWVIDSDWPLYPRD